MTCLVCRGQFDQTDSERCLYCLARFVLSLPKPIRARRIRECCDDYGHDEADLKKEVIRVFKRVQASRTTPAGGGAHNTGNRAQQP